MDIEDSQLAANGTENGNGDEISTAVDAPPQVPEVLSQDTYYTVRQFDSNDSNTIDDDPQQLLQEAPTFDFLEDDPSEMTWGRRFALHVMKKSERYNPHLYSADAQRCADMDDDDAEFRTEDGYPSSHSKAEVPSLERAWAYFEHVNLPRYLTVPKDKSKEPPKTTLRGIVTRIVHKCKKGEKPLPRAVPGEEHYFSRLYSVVATPHHELGDFGLGVGLYFSTLRFLTAITFIAGLIHIPNMIWFASEEYSGDKDSLYGLGLFLKASAICNQTEWVPCPTCERDDFIRNGRSGTFFELKLPDGGSVPLVQHNECDATLQQGMVNYCCLIFLVVAAIYLYFYLRHMEIKFDEGEQTTQDYSVVVKNPPKDATDPKVWRDFFTNAFEGVHVTAVTVAVDNDKLVQALAERRELMKKLEMRVEPGTQLDMVTLSNLAVQEEHARSIAGRLLALVVPGMPEMVARIAVLTAKVQGLALQEYPAMQVFVIFEREADQRRVLKTLTVGQLAVDANMTKSLSDAKHLFQGRVLAVEEPGEPDTIRWQALNVKMLEAIKYLLRASVVTLVLCALVALLIYFVDKIHYLLTSYTISVCGLLFSKFATWVTDGEPHPSHSSRQTSLYFKTGVFRFATTSLILTIITPFTFVLYAGTDGLIRKVQAQFVSQLTLVTVLQLADLPGNIKRHLLAPRAASQDAMNLNMQGTPFELADRYTAMTTIVFLAMWYCSIYPGAFFMCAINLLVIYYTDKFSLLRTWKRCPRWGSEISKFNRSIFFPVSIVVMAVCSSYFFAGLPFDNLCPDDDTVVDPALTGYHRVPLYRAANIADILQLWYHGNNTQFDQSLIIGYDDFPIYPGQTTYTFCEQDMLRSQTWSFPFIPRFQETSWMTPEQAQLCTIYGWTALFFCLLFGFSVFLQILQLVWGYFKGSYNPATKAMKHNFSSIEGKALYIPQVQSSVFAYPLLACSVSDLDPDMLHWTDAERPHAFYDLTKDAHKLTRRVDISRKVVFSQVAHWPPPPEPDNANSEKVD